MSEQDVAEAMQAESDLLHDLIKECPVKPLGHDGGTYYFLSPLGELRMISCEKMSVNGLSSLFAPHQSWLDENFPRKRGKQVVGFEAVKAARFLINACGQEGVFDHNQSVRSHGVWPTSEYDPQGYEKILVHCGDVLYHDHAWIKAGQRIAGAIYPVSHRAERISKKPASAADGAFILDTLKSWNFGRNFDADLLCGFIGQALLGGAPKWRAHMMVNGLAGSGKTTLARLVKAVLGAGAHPMVNNYTEAGLRQALTEQARTLILDEAEAEENGGRIMAVIELLRHMSGDEGSKALRGTAGGKAMGFTVTGCAYLSSILKVPLRPQDRSRITELTINPVKDAGAGAFKELQKRIDQCTKMSAPMRARMIEKWPLFNRHFQAWRGVFLANDLPARSSDQVATLLAGRAVMISDDEPDQDYIAAHYHTYAPIIEAEKEELAENEGVECWNYLLSMPSNAWRGGDRQTIAEMLIEAKETRSTDSDKKLGGIGLRLYFGQDQYNKTLMGVMVANNHAGLNELFKGTRWHNGAWRGALSYLGGQSMGARAFAGVKQRSVLVPPQYFPSNEDESP